MNNTTLVIIAAVGMMIGSTGFAATKACEKETMLKQLRDVCSDTIATMRTAALSTKDQRQADLKSDVRVVETDENPAYTAILDVYNANKDTHVQLWAVTKCHAIGPRHAVFDAGMVGASISGKSVVADVGYKNAKMTGFTEKRTMVPVGCGFATAQDGEITEDLCLYKATTKFPSSVSPIKIFSAKSRDELVALNEKGYLEGVGFTNSSASLNGHRFTLGSSKVKENISGSSLDFFRARFLGLSGSGLLAKNAQSGELYLAGFKVSDVEVVSGKRMKDFINGLADSVSNSDMGCQ